MRYADDFRIFVKDYKTAEKIYHAATMWLKERLKLEISPEKSSIIDLKNRNMKFLGVTYKLRKNKNSKKHKKINQGHLWTSHTSVTQETYQKLRESIRQRAIKIKHTYKHEDRIKAINDFNTYIRGLKYYSITSKWSRISSTLTWETRKVVFNRLRNTTKTQKTSRQGKIEVGRYKRVRNKRTINGIELLKPTDIKHEDVRQLNRGVCKYTKKGRSLVHEQKKHNIDFLFEYFEENISPHHTVEFNVNRVAGLSRQQGLCAVTGEPLQIGFIATHHKIPVKDKGTDETKNLFLMYKIVHEMIHATDKNLLKEKYKQLKASVSKSLKPKVFLEKLNKFREAVKNEKLKIKEIQ